MCGGRSRRMGRDKATLPFGDESLLGREIRILRALAEPIVLVGAPGQDLSPWQAPGLIVGHDREPDRGPLEGIGQGLQLLTGACELAYVTSCDVPFLVPDWVRRLQTLIGQADVAVPVDGEFHHPLAALYRPEVGAVAMELVEQGQRRPIALFDRVVTNRISVEQMRDVDPELQTLMNLNHPADYETALDRLSLP